MTDSEAARETNRPATTLSNLFEQTLPINRKERYYTGTVFPALVCTDSMRQIHLLTDLCGLKTRPDVRTNPDDCSVLFFTEYSVVESLMGERIKKFPSLLQAKKDTPDIVILFTEPSPMILAIEAKVFDRPSKPAMELQLRTQQGQLTALAADLSRLLRTDVETYHVALLPMQLASRFGELPVPTITWQRVRDAYKDVDQEYFLAVLDHALDNYDALVSPIGNEQGFRVGSKLVAEHLAGDPKWLYMGVGGGLDGSRLQDLVTNNTWATREFQVRSEPLIKPNDNWFAIAEFVAYLKDHGREEEVAALAPGGSENHEHAVPSKDDT